MPRAELNPEPQTEHGDEADAGSTPIPPCRGGGFGDLDGPVTSSSFQKQGDGTRLHAERP